MSHHMTSMVFQCFYDGGNTRLIALALADACTDEAGGNIFLSIDTVAQMADVSRPTVQRTMAKLLDDGWLLRRGGNVGGRGRTNTYDINPDWITAVAVERARARVAGDRAAKVFPQRVTLDVKDGPAGSGLAGPVDKSVKGIKLRPFANTERVSNQTVKGIKNGLKGITAVIPEQEQNTLTTPLPPESGGLSDFEKLETEYPRQDVADRDSAYRVWRQLRPSSQKQGIMLAVLRGAKADPRWLSDDGRWVPKLSKWLRGWRVGEGPPVPEPEPPKPKAVRLPRVELTPEQLAANKARARALVDDTRRKMARESLAGSEAGLDGLVSGDLAL
jgi:DNA-binding Lrp family transcriptional regulator